MNPLTEKIQLDTRRHFLRNCGMGLGAGALAHLLTPEAFALKAPQNPLLPRKPHFSEKAKRVIYIHLTGSPPHLDMWDYKPELVKRTDQDCPDEFVKGKMFAFTSGTPNLWVRRVHLSSTESRVCGCQMRFLIFTNMRTISA